MKKLIEKFKPEIISKFENEIITSDVIITKVVDVTTIRAYRNNKKFQPLSMYRVWAQENLITNKEKRNMLINSSDFEAIHKFFSEDFQNFWLKYDGTKLDKIYKVYKIVDLFFKGVSIWDQLPRERRNFYFNNVHSPLDQFSLKFLKQHSEDLEPEIPDNVSMNFIQDDKDKYSRYQSEIMKISKNNNITPYVFDEIAWLVGHSVTKKDELFKLIELSKEKVLKNTILKN